LNTENLKRTIGLVSATSIGLGAMLGAGIFVFPGLAGGQAGFGATISFLIGGIIALAVAACTAELATAMPKSGGGYFFISRSFGNFSGTLTGIAQWIGLVFACAFYLVSFGEYALTILSELNIQWDISTRVFSFCLTFFLLILNIYGTKKVGNLQNIIVISLTIILVLIFTYGLIDYFGFENNSTTFSEIAPDGIQSIFTTTALIFTSYLGFVQIANIGAEIKHPNKNLPKSLIWSVLIAMVLYTFIMLACILTFPQEELNKFGETATIEVARKILGNWGATVVVLGGLLAALSSANASMISASRGVFAMSKDKLIGSKASKINKSFGTPHIALILVAMPIAIILIKSRIEVFAEVASFLHLMIYIGICLCVLKLRRKNPIWYLPVYRVPMGKVIAVLGAASCLALICFMQPTSIFISLLVLLFATVYYFLYVKRKKIILTTPRPPHIDAKSFNPNILIPIDISKEEKSLPSPILEAIPISNLLLLGFKETPEQSQSEQSAEKFGKDGEKKLERILEQLEDADYDFDSKLIFGHNIISQIEEAIKEEDLQFILALKPHSTLNQVVLPIHKPSQINKKLSTIIYKLNSNKKINFKIILFTDGNGNDITETKLKTEIEKQFNLINIALPDYQVIDKSELASKKFLKGLVKKDDLIIWSEAEPVDRTFFLNLILEKKSINLSSPTIMILNKREKEN